MEKFFKNTKKIIFLKQNNILSSALILSLMSIVSRVFGILRFRTLTFFFDAKQIEYFLAAFRVPDFIFEVLITGVLSAAFIPLFIKYEKGGKNLHTNISSIINFILAAMSIFIVVMLVGANYIYPIITPGYSPTEIAYVISLSKILLITQLPFLVLGYITSGIAQSNKIFMVTAVAPIVYNLGMIFGTLFLAHSLGIYAPIIGVGFGALLFFVIQLPTLVVVRFHYQALAHNVKVIHEFVRLFTPRLLSVVATQIDLTVDLALSTFLIRGSYAAFSFAQRLQFFPVSFLGISYGQAALPYLTDLYRDKKMSELRRLYVDSILQLFFLNIPIAIFFIFARTPLVRIVYGGPKFTFESTNITALALSYFAISIPLHTISYFLIRAFYATFNTKTPFFISVFSTIVNTSLSLLAVFVFKKNVAFLALSFSIAISCNAILSLVLFYRRIGGYNYFRLLKTTVKIYACAFLASFVAYPVMKLLDLLILDTTHTLNVLFLLVITMTVFGLSYFFFTWLFNVEELSLLAKLFFTVKEMKRKITEVYTDVG